MKNIDIFTQLYPAGQTRVVQTPTGKTGIYCSHAVGEVRGDNRTILALVARAATPDDDWKVFNLYKDSNALIYVGSVATLGIDDEDSIISPVIGMDGNHKSCELVLKQFSDQLAAVTCRNITQCTDAQTLKLYLDSDVVKGDAPLRSRVMNRFSNLVAVSPVVWNQAQLVSPDLSVLTHEMNKLDTEGELVDAMKATDLPDLVSSVGGTVPEYDSLIVDYDDMEKLSSEIKGALGAASVGEIKPISTTQTKPFKQDGVTTVAILFELNDGQSVTIVFHNPDSVPADLQAGDRMTAWKYLLNKRDVTPAIAPETGTEADISVLARRIMTIVEKNSSRFKRSNISKADLVKQVEDTASRIESKKTDLQVILAEIDDLQQQIDSPVIPLMDSVLPPPSGTSQSNPIGTNPAAEVVNTAEQNPDVELDPATATDPLVNDLVAPTPEIEPLQGQEILPVAPDAPVVLPEVVLPIEEPSVTEVPLVAPDPIPQTPETTLSVSGETLPLPSTTSELEANAVVLPEPQQETTNPEVQPGFDDQTNAETAPVVPTPASVDTPAEVVSQGEGGEGSGALVTIPAVATVTVAERNDGEYLQQVIGGQVEPLSVDLDDLDSLKEKYKDDAEMTKLIEQVVDAIGKAEIEKNTSAA